MGPVEEIAKLKRDLQEQARIAGELEARQLGVRREPVEEAERILSLYIERHQAGAELDRAVAKLREVLGLGE